MEGRQCDRCKENKYDRQLGCVDCPACYNLIQDAVNAQRADLHHLDIVLKEIADNPTVIDDIEFEQTLGKVMINVEEIWRDAKDNAGGNYI